MPYFVSLDTILRVDESEAINREQAIQAAIRQLKMHLDNPESGLIWQVEEDIAYDAPVMPTANEPAICELHGAYDGRGDCLKCLSMKQAQHICPECGSTKISVEESETCVAVFGTPKAGQCRDCKHNGPLIEFEYDLEPDDW